MKAINVRILPATNTLPARLRVTDGDHAMTVSGDTDRYAARLAAKKFIFKHWLTSPTEPNLCANDKRLYWDSWNNEQVWIVGATLNNGYFFTMVSNSQLLNGETL